MMFVHQFDAEDPDSPEFQKMRQFFGPGQVDQTVRQAVHWCWMGLPKEKRSVEEVERQVCRLADRALRHFREDRDAFLDEGAGGAHPPGEAASEAQLPGGAAQESDAGEDNPPVVCCTTSVAGAGSAGLDKMREFFGPGFIDQMIRVAVISCWTVLPKARRSDDELEQQIRRLLDRALRDFREDQAAFSGPAE